MTINDIHLPLKDPVISRSVCGLSRQFAPVSVRPFPEQTTTNHLTDGHKKHKTLPRDPGGRVSNYWHVGRTKREHKSKLCLVSVMKGCADHK